MRFLLPPSETKRDGVGAGPIEVSELTAPSLTADRVRVLGALSKYCAKPSPRVRAAIGTTANQDAELLRNAALLTAPVSPAYAVYDGVLFDALELATASAAVHARIVERTLVQSALFGVVGFGDRIPPYRCSADSTLPRIGRLGTFWRKRLEGVMHEILAQHFVLDLRSGQYESMWRPTGAVADRYASVRVVQERDGKRLAVSHFNKATKGRIVRALCESPRDLTSADAIGNVLARAGFELECTRVSGRTVLDVMMR